MPAFDPLPPLVTGQTYDLLFTINSSLLVLTWGPLYFALLILIIMSIAFPICASAVTRDEAIDWLTSWDGTTGGINLAGTNYGYQCTDFVSGYMNWLVCGDYTDTDYYVAYTPSYYPTVASWNTDRWEVIDNTSDFVADPGDIFVSNAHVGVVVSSTRTEAWVVEQNTREGYNSTTGTLPWYHKITWTAKGNGTYGVNKYIRFRQFDPELDPEPDPEPMSKGYDRVLPDGDYIIAACANPLYFLDIAGTAKPASKNTDVQLYKVNNLDDIAESDIWTITYNSSDKFYTIKQKGTDMCLDVEGNGRAHNANVQVFPSSGDPDTHKWAISISAGDAKGYRIQAKCSGFYLDMKSGLGIEMDVRQHKGTDSNDERWVFIPYKPSQPISAGRYIIASKLYESYIMDVEGDTGNIANNTKVRLWSDTADNQYNCFDIIPLSNGYYKFVHTASGKALDLRGATTDNRSSISIYEDNGSRSQQWAITKNGSGYTIWVRCSGKVVDMKESTPINGREIFQYYYTGGAIQTWTFVPAEYVVSYDANGGSGAPDNQTKYYKNGLTLSDGRPSCEGHQFKGWAADQGANTAIYQPGDEYSSDENITLYAVWEAEKYTISFDTNGGETPNFQQTKTYGKAINLSTEVPQRKGYTLLGWASSKDATTADYKPGDAYSEEGDKTLYAVWTITNPPKLIPVGNAVMILGDEREWSSFVTLEHDGVLSYTLSASLTGSGTISGSKLIADSSGTAILTVSVNECPSVTCAVEIPILDLSRKVTLPVDLTEIGSEAFANTKLSAVVIPDGCTHIGYKAFANNMALVYVYIPNSVQYIADDAFSGSDNINIHCAPNSAAANYASSHGIRYFTK